MEWRKNPASLVSIDDVEDAAHDVGVSDERAQNRPPLDVDDLPHRQAVLKIDHKHPVQIQTDLDRSIAQRDERQPRRRVCPQRRRHVRHRRGRDFVAEDRPEPHVAVVAGGEPALG
jgi:hypothetical protein